MHSLPTSLNSRLPSAALLAFFALLRGVRGPAVDGLSDSARGEAASPVALQCAIDASPTAALSITLTNGGDSRLVEGSRLAWATLGSPMPVGGSRSLPIDLASGQSVRIATGLHGSASGCVARLSV